MIPKWITTKVFAWSLYDFADTAFSALVISLFFPILIKVYLGGNEFQIGLAMSLSVIIAALSVPFIGAISDASRRRMPILIGAALATAVVTVLLGYSGLWLALFFGFLGHITHLISKDVYDAKMIDIVPRSLFGSLSGFGIGIGYFGAITSLVVGHFLLSYLGWESIAGVRAIFWEAAAFYIIFSLPLFLLVPDKTAAKIKFAEAVKRGFGEFKQTITSFTRFPIFARFLTASFFYNNGMNTVIVFFALFAREVAGLGMQQFFPIYIVLAFAAAIGSFIFGRLSDKLGPVTLIKLVLLVWIAILILLIFAPSPRAFIIVGSIGGIALGAIWTLNRHMVAKISPKHKIAELFGFEGLTEKFSGFLGPVIFGYLVVTFNYATALVSLILFFVIGLIFMQKLYD